MKLSIRGKVCLSLTGFSLFCSFTMGLITTGGFESFYYQFKKNGMANLGRDLGKLYNEQGNAAFTNMDQVSQKIGTDFFIIKEGKLIYASRMEREPHAESAEQQAEAAQKLPVPPQPPPQKMPMMMTADHSVPPVMPDDDTPDAEKRPGQPMHHILEVMEGLKDPGRNTMDEGDMRFYISDRRFKLLDLIYCIHDDTYLVITQPVAPIDESVEIVKQFVWICGILWFVAGVLGALLFSRRLTRPLLELKEQAVHMTNLDFSQTWKHKSKDEIGQLGQSLNRLSDQLNTALTKLQESNVQLQMQLDKAKEVEHMRKEFISAVSHELKTPLAIIQGYAEALDDIAFDEETKQRYSHIIRNETEKMDHLVKDLLNLSRLETGSFRLDCTDFDFCALAEETKERFSQAVAEKHIDMVWNLPGEMSVNGDPERIDLILSNYLSNAIDHTEEGRCIRVSVEELEQAYRINVYNQGIQIAPDNQKRLWTAFFKVDTARTRTFGGHGLGLSIVAALVKLHKQKYGMHNVDDGVVFWFTIAKSKT